jgi:hypothetical protein
MDYNLAPQPLVPSAGLVPRHLRKRPVVEATDEAEFIAIPTAPPEPQGPPVDAITADLRRRIASTRPPPRTTPLKMAGSACAGIGVGLLMLYM